MTSSISAHGSKVFGEIVRALAAGMLVAEIVARWRVSSQTVRAIRRWRAFR